MSLLKLIQVVLERIGLISRIENPHNIHDNSGITTYRTEGTVTEVRLVTNNEGEPVTLVTVKNGDVTYRNGIYGHNTGIQIGDVISYQTNLDCVIYSVEGRTLLEYSTPGLINRDVMITSIHYQMVDVRFPKRI